MSTVLFKRSANINQIPIVDGQLVFDETHNKIYMDNGTERLQYGGDVSLIEDTSYATSNNTFSANGSLDIFTQKLSVIDNKDSALAVTEQHVPVGCLAFQSAIGNADYSAIGNTISDSLITLKNGIVGINGQLTVNNEQFYFDYQNGKYGYNTSPTRGADTFNPFSGAKEYTATYSCTVGSHGEGYGYSAGAGEIPCSAYNYAEVTAWGNNSPSGQGYVTLSIAKSGVVDLTDIDTITYSLQAYSNVQAGGNRAYFTIHMWV